MEQSDDIRDYDAFIERAWRAISVYMSRLLDPAVVSRADARVSARVVMHLAAAMERERAVVKSTTERPSDNLLRQIQTAAAAAKNVAERADG